MALYGVMLVLTVLFGFLSQRQLAVTAGGAGDMSWRGKCRSLLGALLAFIPLLLVSALRDGVGIDYESYQEIFYNIVLYGQRTHVEWGYYWLNRLVGCFTLNPQWVFGVSSLLVLGLFMAGIYRYAREHMAFTLFLFIAMGYYFYTMSSIRYYIAVACAFHAGFCIRDSRLLAAVAYIGLGALFHKSILIALPLYLLATLRFTEKFYLIFTGLGSVFVALSPFLRQLFFWVYPSYAGSKFDVIGRFSLYNVALAAGVLLWALLYRRQLLLGGNQFFLNIALFAFIFYGFCSWWIPESSRIGFYLSIFNIVLVPTLVKGEGKANVRAFYTFCTVTLFTLFLVSMLQKVDSTVGYAPFLPYRFCF